MSVCLKPIGRVALKHGRYFIELEPQYTQAALGLEEYSHIQVIWWFHLCDDNRCRGLLALDKPYKNGPERVGVLATRSPIRPNPIALTACELVGLDSQQHSLELAWIDAENGTPVLDIKPYQPSVDRVRDVKMPGWCAHWPACAEESGAFDWGSEFNF